VTIDSKKCGEKIKPSDHISNKALQSRYLIKKLNTPSLFARSEQEMLSVAKRGFKLRTKSGGGILCQSG